MPKHRKLPVTASGRKKRANVSSDTSVDEIFFEEEKGFESDDKSGLQSSDTSDEYALSKSDQENLKEANRREKPKKCQKLEKIAAAAAVAASVKAELRKKDTQQISQTTFKPRNYNQKLKTRENEKSRSEIITAIAVHPSERNYRDHMKTNNIQKRVKAVASSLEDINESRKLKPKSIKISYNQWLEKVAAAAAPVRKVDKGDPKSQRKTKDKILGKKTVTSESTSSESTSSESTSSDDSQNGKNKPADATDEKQQQRPEKTAVAAAAVRRQKSKTKTTKKDTEKSTISSISSFSLGTNISKNSEKNTKRRRLQKAAVAAAAAREAAAEAAIRRQKTEFNKSKRDFVKTNISSISSLSFGKKINENTETNTKRWRLQKAAVAAAAAREAAAEAAIRRQKTELNKTKRDFVKTNISSISSLSLGKKINENTETKTKRWHLEKAAMAAAAIREKNKKDKKHKAAASSTEDTTADDSKEFNTKSSKSDYNQWLEKVAVAATAARAKNKDQQAEIKTKKHSDSTLPEAIKKFQTKKSKENEANSTKRAAMAAVSVIRRQKSEMKTGQNTHEHKFNVTSMSSLNLSSIKDFKTSDRHLERAAAAVAALREKYKNYQRYKINTLQEDSYQSKGNAAAIPSESVIESQKVRHKEKQGQAKAAVAAVILKKIKEGKKFKFKTSKGNEKAAQKVGPSSGDTIDKQQVKETEKQRPEKGTVSATVIREKFKDDQKNKTKKTKKSENAANISVVSEEGKSIKLQKNNNVEHGTKKEEQKKEAASSLTSLSSFPSHKADKTTLKKKVAAAAAIAALEGKGNHQKFQIKAHKVKEKPSDTSALSKDISRSQRFEIKTIKVDSYQKPGKEPAPSSSCLLNELDIKKIRIKAAKKMDTEEQKRIAAAVAAVRDKINKDPKMKSIKKSEVDDIKRKRMNNRKRYAPLISGGDYHGSLTHSEYTRNQLGNWPSIHYSNRFKNFKKPLPPVFDEMPRKPINDRTKPLVPVFDEMPRKLIDQRHKREIAEIPKIIRRPTRLYSGNVNSDPQLKKLWPPSDSGLSRQLQILSHAFRSSELKIRNAIDLHKCISFYGCEAFKQILRDELAKSKIKSLQCDRECVLQNVFNSEMKKYRENIASVMKAVKREKNKQKGKWKDKKKVEWKDKKKVEWKDKKRKSFYQTIIMGGNLTVEGPIEPYRNYVWTIIEYFFFLFAYFAMGACMVPMILYSFEAKHSWTINLHIFLVTIGYQFLVPLAILGMSRFDFTANYHSYTERYKQGRIFRIIAFFFLVFSVLVMMFAHPWELMFVIFDNGHVIFGFYAFLLSFAEIKALMRGNNEDTYTGYVYALVNALTFLCTSLSYGFAVKRPTVSNWLPYNQMWYHLFILCMIYTFIVISVPIRAFRKFIIKYAYQLMYSKEPYVGKS